MFIAQRSLSGEHNLRRHGQAFGHQQLLGEFLIHPDGRRQHSGAHVRNSGQLEQALHRPVLTKRPVQDRDDDVHLGIVLVTGHVMNATAGGGVEGESKLIMQFNFGETAVNNL